MFVVMCEGMGIYVILPCGGFGTCALFYVYSFSRPVNLKYEEFFIYCYVRFDSKNIERENRKNQREKFASVHP
jgi:hypothetical protein